MRPPPTAARRSGRSPSSSRGVRAARLGAGGGRAASHRGEVDESHAAEEIAEENGGTEFDAHCIAILAEGGSVDDCQEAPSPILPETNEIIWGAIGFARRALLRAGSSACPAIKKG